MLQILRKVQEERSAHVAVKLGEALVLGEVRVPYANGLVDVEFARQVTAYPPISKGYEVYFEFLQMLQSLWISLLDQRLHFINYLVDSWLQICIIILDVID